MNRWFAPSSPDLIVAKPWLSPEATEYFDKMLRANYDVMEYGGGGSTLWLARKVKSVVTYEPNELWYKKLGQVKPNNVTLRFSYLPPASAEVDILYIDGDPVIYRGLWLGASHAIVKPGGFVVLDNANRGEYKYALQEFATVAKLLHRTAASEGTDYTVTEFYQL